VLDIDVTNDNDCIADGELDKVDVVIGVNDMACVNVFVALPATLKEASIDDDFVIDVIPDGLRNADTVNAGEKVDFEVTTADIDNACVKECVELCAALLERELNGDELNIEVTEGAIVELMLVLGERDSDENTVVDPWKLEERVYMTEGDKLAILVAELIPESDGKGEQLTSKVEPIGQAAGQLQGVQVKAPANEYVPAGHRPSQTRVVRLVVARPYEPA
jgi:hypothetical protein